MENREPEKKRFEIKCTLQHPMFCENNIINIGHVFGFSSEDALQRYINYIIKIKLKTDFRSFVKMMNSIFCVYDRESSNDPDCYYLDTSLTPIRKDI